MNVLEVAIFTIVMLQTNQPFTCTLANEVVGCTNGVGAALNGDGRIEFQNGVQVVKMVDGTLIFTNGTRARWGSAGWIHFSNGMAVRRMSDGSYKFNNGLSCRYVGRTDKGEEKAHCGKA